MLQPQSRRWTLGLIALISLALIVPVPGLAQDGNDTGNQSGNDTGNQTGDGGGGAGAQAETLTVTAHDGGGEYWFEVEGMEGKNPAITLKPGTEYTVTLENKGDEVHNLHFGAPVDKATDLIFSGESAELTITVPEDASGDAQYWCDPHRDLGMEGALKFGSGGGGQNGGGNGQDGGGDPQEAQDGGGIPGFGAALLLGAVAISVIVGAIAGRRKR